MDLHEIRRLARDGIAEFVPDRLESAAHWLMDYSEATGDARYSSLSATVMMISDAFEHQSGNVFNDTIDELNAILAAAVPEILDSSEPTVTAGLARQLRLQVEATLGQDAQCVEERFRDKRGD